MHKIRSYLSLTVTIVHKCSGGPAIDWVFAQRELAKNKDAGISPELLETCAHVGASQHPPRADLTSAPQHSGHGRGRRISTSTALSQQPEYSTEDLTGVGHPMPPPFYDGRNTTTPSVGGESEKSSTTTPRLEPSVESFAPVLGSVGDGLRLAHSSAPAPNELPKHRGDELPERTELKPLGGPAVDPLLTMKAASSEDEKQTTAESTSLPPIKPPSDSVQLESVQPVSQPEDPAIWSLESGNTCDSTRDTNNDSSNTSGADGEEPPEPHRPTAEYNAPMDESTREKTCSRSQSQQPALPQPHTSPDQTLPSATQSEKAAVTTSAIEMESGEHSKLGIASLPVDEGGGGECPGASVTITHAESEQFGGASLLSDAASQECSRVEPGGRLDLVEGSGGFVNERADDPAAEVRQELVPVTQATSGRPAGCANRASCETTPNAVSLEGGGNLPQKPPSDNASSLLLPEGLSAKPQPPELPPTKTPHTGATHTEEGPVCEQSTHQETGRDNQPSQLPSALTEVRRAAEASVDGELQKAREAWRGAEGELLRSQEEADELRLVLQAVREVS